MSCCEYSFNRLSNYFCFVRHCRELFCAIYLRVLDKERNANAAYPQSWGLYYWCVNHICANPIYGLAHRLLVGYFISNAWHCLSMHKACTGKTGEQSLAPLA